MTQIAIAFGIFAAIAAILGIILAIASKVFFVKTDARVEQISSLLPGANCGGCGYAGCAALAEAIVEGKAPVNACNSCSDETAKKIADIMGLSSDIKTVKLRAQVMCSGTNDLAKKKYVYEGVSDCVAANRLAGGDKLCPNGCIGLGTCEKACPFGAVKIINGVAAVDFEKCRGCGVCVSACPKKLIRLVPADIPYWVGCMSADKGAITKGYCDAGCIGCKLCEKNCPSDAVHVDGNVARIDYTKCIGCGKCESVCPRKIIWSAYKKTTVEIAEPPIPPTVSEAVIPDHSDESDTQN